MKLQDESRRWDTSSSSLDRDRPVRRQHHAGQSDADDCRSGTAAPSKAPRELQKYLNFMGQFTKCTTSMTFRACTQQDQGRIKRLSCTLYRDQAMTRTSSKPSIHSYIYPGYHNLRSPVPSHQITSTIWPPWSPGTA